MSVAFRRESDEEHKEPRFELPIPPGPNLVTERGLALLKAKVGELEAVIGAESDETALEALKRELRYFHTRLATAQLAPPAGEDQVGIGSRVTVRNEQGEARHRRGWRRRGPIPMRIASLSIPRWPAR